MTAEWLEQRLYEVDLLWYGGHIDRHECAERKDALGQLYSNLVNRQAVLAWRNANSKAYRGVAQFYGLTWLPDRQQSVFRKGSLDLSRLERSPNLLLSHSPARRLGRIEDVEQDDWGAFCTAKFDKTPEGRNWRTIVRERLEKGKSVYASVGLANGSRAHATRRPNGLELKSYTHAPIEEFSVVQYPAQPRAEFLSCT
jgi:phage head maturation protease